MRGTCSSWCGPWAEVRTWPDAGRTAPPDRPHAASRSRVRRRGRHRRSVTSASPTASTPSFGGRKSYFIFQFDLIFAHGRVRLGNDVNQVLVTGPSPRYSGFVELTEASWRLEGPGGPPLVSVLADAVRAGAADLASLDAAIRALALGIATVQAGATPGVAVTPATLDPTFVVDSV